MTINNERFTDNKIIADKLNEFFITSIQEIKNNVYAWDNMKISQYDLRLFFIQNGESNNATFLYGSLDS